MTNVECVKTGLSFISLETLEARVGPPLLSSRAYVTSVQFEDHFLLLGGWDGAVQLDQILSFGSDQVWYEEAQKLRYPRNGAVALKLESWPGC